MIALRQQATILLNAIPEEKLLPVIQYMQHIHNTTAAEKSTRDIDISKYAGSACNVFGKGVDIDSYLKETRSDERF